MVLSAPWWPKREYDMCWDVPLVVSLVFGGERDSEWRKKDPPLEELELSCEVGGERELRRWKKPELCSCCWRGSVLVLKKFMNAGWRLAVNWIAGGVGGLLFKRRWSVDAAGHVDQGWSWVQMLGW